jgi:hypothetical protein
MSGIHVEQGTTAPQAPQGPAIPPVPPRAGAGTGATAPTAPAGQAADQAGAAAQSAADQVRQEIARIQETGQPQIIIPPPYRDSRNDIPPEVIPLVGMVMGTVMAIVLGYPIIRFIIKMIERRADNTTLRAQDVTVQLRALQDSVDTMAIELERISEAQRFQAKLAVEREGRAISSGER